MEGSEKEGEIITIEEEELALGRAIRMREISYGFSEINAVIDVLDKIHQGYDMITPYLMDR